MREFSVTIGMFDGDRDNGGGTDDNFYFKCESLGSALQEILIYFQEQNLDFNLIDSIYMRDCTDDEDIPDYSDKALSMAYSTDANTYE